MSALKGKSIRRLQCHGLLRSVLYSDADAAMSSIEGTVNGAGSAIEWFREVAEIDPERALTPQGLG